MFKSAQAGNAREYAPGIPDKGRYGDPMTGLTEGQLADYVLQRHETARQPQRPHLDLRLGSPSTNLHSWALPKAHMPSEKEKLLAVQTQLHDFGYGSFTGPIGRGYGRGLVSMEDKGKARITKVSPDAVHFTLAHTKVPASYTLVRTGGKDGRQWLLLHSAGPKSKPVVYNLGANQTKVAIKEGEHMHIMVKNGIARILDKLAESDCSCDWDIAPSAKKPLVKPRRLTPAPKPATTNAPVVKTSRAAAVFAQVRALLKSGQYVADEYKPDQAQAISTSQTPMLPAEGKPQGGTVQGTAENLAATAGAANNPLNPAVSVAGSLTPGARQTPAPKTPDQAANPGVGTGMILMPQPAQQLDRRTSVRVQQ
jgi:hypothetical protein